MVFSTISRACVIVIAVFPAVCSCLQVGDVTVVSVNSRPHMLSCYQCSHRKGDPDLACLTLYTNSSVPTPICSLTDPFCKVLSLRRDNTIEFLGRSCTDKCKPGCIQMNSIEQCESCCTQPLCNTGSGFKPVFQAEMAVIISVTLLSLACVIL